MQIKDLQTSAVSPQRQPASASVVSFPQSFKDPPLDPRQCQGRTTNLRSSHPYHIISNNSQYHCGTRASLNSILTSPSQASASPTSVSDQAPDTNQAMLCNHAWQIQHPQEYTENSSNLPQFYPERNAFGTPQMSYSQSQPHQVPFPHNGHLHPRGVGHNLTQAHQFSSPPTMTTNLGTPPTSREHTPHSHGSRSISPSYNNILSPTVSWSQLDGTTDFTHAPMDGSHACDTTRENSNNVPYNQLLWQCLMGMHGYEAQLKDIYSWFEQHTEKAKDPRQKGWQNSIRHNLSMNEVSFTGLPMACG